MIPAKFDYKVPESLEEALRLMRRHGNAAKVLSGGHSLLPLMKLRLSQPELLIDLRRVPRLDRITKTKNEVRVGARVTHGEIARSDVIAGQLPLLKATAATIGDAQVRNRGTIGGNLAHADPASDLPAAVIALKAKLELASSRGKRTVEADGFFVDLLTTALRPDELITSITFPIPESGSGWSYQKLFHPASHYAVVGIAVMLKLEVGRCVSASVGVTGLGSKAGRAAGVEAALLGKRLTDRAIAAAAERVTEGFEALEDIHASAEYREHVARVHARRAIAEAISRAR